MKGVGRQMLVFSGLDLYARWVGVNSIPVLDDFRCGGVETCVFDTPE